MEENTSKALNMLDNFLVHPKTLKPNFNTYDAEPPNECALEWKKITIDLLLEQKLYPVHIAASAENGVGIVILNNTKYYCDIEFFNGGEIAAIFVTKNSISKKSEAIVAWDIEVSRQSVRESIQRILALVQENDQK